MCECCGGDCKMKDDYVSMLFYDLATALTDRAIDIGKELGDSCDYWIDKEIYLSIKHDDPMKQEELRTKYYNLCHEPIVFYKPHDNQIRVECRQCDLRKPRQCNRIFPKIAEFLFNQMKENEGIE